MDSSPPSSFSLPAPLSCLNHRPFSTMIVLCFLLALPLRLSHPIHLAHRHSKFDHSSAIAAHRFTARLLERRRLPSPFNHSDLRRCLLPPTNQISGCCFSTFLPSCTAIGAVRGWRSHPSTSRHRHRRLLQSRHHHS